MSSAIGLDVFYPIVPDIAWLERLLRLGVRTVQLRMKDVPPAAVRPAVATAVSACDAAGTTLIVNDYWREAIDGGASFVHLGQEDLAAADVTAMKAAGLRLGVSTHDRRELQVALAAEPDYIALGPIFETKLKAMPWTPQGLARITEWKKAIGAIPLVAIGGLTPERASQAIDAGAASAAVITDFLTAPDPDRRIAEWVQWADNFR